ncbi:aldehyde ferredoxin oxidoreductase [Candidatus Bathyarchaeota archaeon]|nr:MAG: aldehyde ferredoxin oxidoreductase [Candidatus Bathyarchaeota archaeon]
MPYGYWGRLLEVNLSTGDVKTLQVDKRTMRKYVGGRGLGVKILWDRLGDRWEEIDPLGPDNILLILTGPLTGYYPGSRVCVAGKSPQSNGVVGSTVGGEFGVELKSAGYDGIIITGESEKPVYLWINDDEVEIRDASHLWGKEAKDTLRILTRELIDEMSKKKPLRGLCKEPSILYIGPAGERKVRIAAVAHKLTHAAGYGGYGAVMGAKKLKAIAVKGSGPLPDVADLEGFKKLLDSVCKVLIKEFRMRYWGTGWAGYTVGADTSSEPIRNWQEEWHDEARFGVSFFEKYWIKRFWGDFGCPTTCLKIAFIRSGRFKGVLTDNPDYELQAYLGTNLGIFDPEGNIYLSSRADELGLCGIQTGNVMGFAAELYQRGILTKDDIGFELKWGDVEAFAKLQEMIARREGIGDLLAEGTYRAAVKISEMKKVDVMPYAIQVKGIGVGAHGIRSGLDYTKPTAYVCSLQGGDHTSVSNLDDQNRPGEYEMILLDSIVACWFNYKKQYLYEFFKVVAGWNLTEDEWYGELAPRIAAIQRTLLLLGGPDAYWNPRIHDENPQRFYEPLPSGPKKGALVKREEIEKLKKTYYEAAGWDENGLPKPETLKRLGITELEKALERIRHRLGLT